MVETLVQLAHEHTNKTGDSEMMKRATKLKAAIDGNQHPTKAIATNPRSRPGAGNERVIDPRPAAPPDEAPNVQQERATQSSTNRKGFDVIPAL